MTSPDTASSGLLGEVARRILEVSKPKRLIRLGSVVRDIMYFKGCQNERVVRESM
jgi:hypothetical protein